MHNASERIAKTIRMKEEVYHQARVAAVTCRVSVGQWLEEAILEKLCRELSSTADDVASEGTD